METKREASSNIIDNDRGEISVVVDVGRRRSSCGYCKSGFGTRITHGLRSQSLTVNDYQALLDRGWRRSGCYLYKSEMEKTCCPSYTIRLKTSDFVPSKEQVRVSKRMQRFLYGSLNVKKPDEQNETSDDFNNLSNSDSASSVQREVMVDNELQMNNTDQVLHYLSDQIDSAVLACTKRGQFPSDIQFSKASVKTVAALTRRKLLAEDSQHLLYSSNISFQIAATLRRANKSVRVMKSTGSDTEKVDQYVEPTTKFIAEVLSADLSNLATDIGLFIKACNGNINFYSTDAQPQVGVIVEQPAVPKDSSTSSSSKMSSSNRPVKFHPKRQCLEIRLKRSSFDPEEYALYRKYQIKVHNDTLDHVTEASYKRFLVDSPLIFVPPSGDSTVPPSGFGSFHQQYLINGRILAVGVIDILPKCLSSKYLFWDPDLAFLSLGKYTALQEINWVRESQSLCPSLQYYYLGYYIHSCNKMRYKAAYRPSELLCPLRYQWVPFDIANRLLDTKPYVVLSDFVTSQNEAVSPPNPSEDQTQQDEPFPDKSNDVPICTNKDRSELAFEDSNDESGPETTCLRPAQIIKDDVNNIVIGMKGMHLKYKDTRQDFETIERNNLETKLHNYVTAVGADLSKRMIYSLD